MSIISVSKICDLSKIVNYQYWGLKVFKKINFILKILKILLLNIRLVLSDSLVKYEDLTNRLYSYIFLFKINNKVYIID